MPLFVESKKFENFAFSLFYLPIEYLFYILFCTMHVIEKMPLYERSKSLQVVNKVLDLQRMNSELPEVYMK